MYLTISLSSSPDPHQERCLTEQDMDDDEDDGPHVSRLLDGIDCLTARIDQLERRLVTLEARFGEMDRTSILWTARHLLRATQTHLRPLDAVVSDSLKQLVIVKYNK